MNGASCERTITNDVHVGCRVAVAPSSGLDLSFVMPNELPRSGHEAVKIERMQAAFKQPRTNHDSTSAGGTLIPVPGGPTMIFGAKYVE